LLSLFQGGESAGVNHMSVGLRFDDLPPSVTPFSDVVRACLRSDVSMDHDLRLAVDVVTVKDPACPLFGEQEVVANRDIVAGELGPYAGMLLRDDEALAHLAKRPRSFLRAMHFW
jgi:hypothetical protein